MPGPEDLDATQRRLLDHEARRAVYELVARAPGLTGRSIADRLGLGHKVVQNHLERLEAYELVHVGEGERGDERVCVLVDDVGLLADEAMLVLYGHAATRRVALFLLEYPGCTTDAIADALDRHPRTIREHLTRLRERGLAERLWLERRVEHYPTDELETWDRQVDGDYLRPWEDQD